MRSRARARLPYMYGYLYRAELNPYRSSRYRGGLILTRSQLAYSPNEGAVRKMSDRAIGGRLNRTELYSSWFSVRPYALVGKPRELHVAGLCILLLGAVLVAEVLTPDTVVSALALLPLLAGLWVLSARLAGLVAIVAAVFFGVAVALEDADRTTMILLGVAISITAVIVRLHAAALASGSLNDRRERPTVENGVAPLSLDGAQQPPSGLMSLTRRELEVARLAAEGYTAAEIGRRLYIGVRTVESHLAGAYSKLGINSRLQLIRMADRLGFHNQASEE
jgi:DNA-binding CsgD family transcriptional regulator